jgi:hypothetical protein
MNIRDEQSPWKVRAAIGLGILFVFVIVMVKATVLVRHGEINGRLAIPPPYDDVVYFTDALERLQIFHRNGLPALLTNLAQQLPHAPYSTAAAFVAFQFGGVSQKGPYLVNAVAIALLLAFLFAKFHMRSSVVIPLALVTVALPWFDFAVTVFHPDLIAGLGAAVIAATLLWHADTLRTRLQAFSIGVAAGLVLLMKPVAFAMLLVLWATALIFGIAIAWSRDRHFSRQIVRLSFVTLGVALIAGPYFAVKFGDIISYINLGFVVQHDIWTVNRSLWESLTYYPGYVVRMFGWPGLGAAGAFWSVAIVLALREGDRPTAWRFLGFLPLFGVAYLLPTLPDVKTELFGGVLYGCILVWLLMSLAYVLERGARSWRSRAVLMATASLSAIVCIGDHQSQWSSQAIQELNDQVDQLYTVANNYAHNGQLKDKFSKNSMVPVLFSCPFPPPHAVRFRAMRDGWDFLIAKTRGLELNVWKDLSTSAAMIVVPDDRFLQKTFDFPSNHLIPELRNWLEHDNRFTRIATVNSSAGAIDVYGQLGGDR